MSRTRIYSVRHVLLQHTWLVRAASAAAALRHVSQHSHHVEVASQDELVRLLSAGVKVEDVSAEEPAPVSDASSPEEPPSESPCHLAPNGGESGQQTSGPATPALTGGRVDGHDPVLLRAGEESEHPIPAAFDRRVPRGA